MSKPGKKRKSASGQYVSPLLNELEWLEEEAEERPVASEKKKPRIRKAKAQTKKKKPGPTAKINFNTRDVEEAPWNRRSAPTAPPLILIDKPKPRSPKPAWVKALFDANSWTDENLDTNVADAIHSFQLGLDGILKSGEELKLFPPRRRPLVIDVDPGEEEESSDQAASSVIRELAENEAPEEEGKGYESAPEREVRELQQYGLLPFRFEPLDDWLDVTISFAEPFAAHHYALVATTNQPGCYTVIREKRPDYAVVRLIRDTLPTELGGELNWIALGEGVRSDSH